MPLPKVSEPLPELTVRLLKTVLHDATVLVHVDGRACGTAFFVNDRLLLTCFHVVEGAERVEIQPLGRERRDVTVIAQDQEADLALLRRGERDQEPVSCVVLDTTLADGTFWLAGFPRAELVNEPGFECRRYDGGPREAIQGGYQMLRFGSGENITIGMSGGPALDARTGAVVAVTRWSKDTREALGGAGVPIATAAATFPQIAGLLSNSIVTMKAWRDALGSDRWRDLGRAWDIGAEVDLRVTGTRRSWVVTMGTDRKQDMTGRDLGEDVADALFRWAQRRHVRDKDEVLLLGPLLASALFPPDVANGLELVRPADNVMVRLHVDHGSDLTDIPWELAAVPGARDSFLAADEPFRFVRVSDTDLAERIAQPSARLATDPADVRVLAAVAQPGHWQRQWPAVLPRHRGIPYRWPTPKQIGALLSEHIEGAGFVADVRTAPQWSEVKEALQTGKYSVLHFMGVGQREGEKTARIAFVDEDGNGESWEDPRTVIQTAAACGVRLVVLELLMPPTDYDYETLSPSTMGDVITGSVEAVVLTQQPVHPKQCSVFNRAFYQTLGHRRSIESAVQAGRRTLKVDKPVEDAAGFGWFAAVTGPRSGIQLLTAASVRRPTTEVRATTTTQQPEDHASWQEAGDVLHR